MTRSLDPRIRRLEERDGGRDRRRQQIEDDAAVFVKRMNAIAAGYSDEDRGCGPATRAKWSKAQHVAWAMRFAPDRVAPILQEKIA